MPRKKFVQTTEDHFGERLAAMRKTAGFTQRRLAKSSGISQRMIAYYETRATMPLGQVLSTLSETLGISVDELVGKKPAKTAAPTKRKRTQVSHRLLRRLQEMEKLPLKDKRELLSIIDTYLEKNRLAQRSD